MLAKICFAFFCILAIRSVVLMIGERKPAAVRLLDFVFAALFGAVAAILFVVLRMRIMDQPIITILVFGAILIPVILLLGLRMKLPYIPRPGWMALKVIVVLIAVSLSLVSVMMSGFEYLTEDRPVLKIVMTGVQSDEQIQWQPPNGIQRNEKLKTYEVQFQTPDGRPVSQFYIYGDQAAVKARVIRFKPALNLIGIHNLCRIEYVHNGYVNADRFNFYPHHAWEIKGAHPWIEGLQDPFWKYWEQLFRGKENPAIKSATVESNYFPLTDTNGLPYKGSFFLTITPGGLSSIPLP